MEDVSDQQQDPLNQQVVFLLAFLPALVRRKFPFAASENKESIVDRWCQRGAPSFWVGWVLPLF